MGRCSRRHPALSGVVWCRPESRPPPWVAGEDLSHTRVACGPARPVPPRRLTVGWPPCKLVEVNDMTEHSQEATGRLAERRRGLGRRMIRRQSALLSALGIVALGLTLLSSVPSNASTTVRPASSILLQSRFLNRNSAKCLGVLRGDMTNGTPAVQWTCDGSANQQWVRFSDA